MKSSLTDFSRNASSEAMSDITPEAARCPQIILVLHNIRSTYNVGAILRTAEGFGVEEVILSGYTPRVHDPNLLPHLRAQLDKQIHKTALGAEDMLKIDLCDDLSQRLSDLHERGWTILGLDNNIARKTLPIGDFRARADAPEQIVLLLGEEVHGIDPALYGQIDYFVEIPMRGQKESFNVSVATGIALYALS